MNKANSILAKINSIKFPKGKFLLTIKNDLTKNKRKIFSTLLGTYLYYNYMNYINQKKAYSCGIISYLGKEPNAIDVCTEGIQLLQFRGYDSAGICTINSKGDYQITKYASDIKDKEVDCIQKIVEEVPKLHEKSFIGIGHTRWATHGKKTTLNAHPHVDFRNKISLVHNGVLDNYKEIKDSLEKKNIPVLTECDTEVIAQLIGDYYSNGLSFKDSVSRTLNSDIVGTYALVIMNKDEPNKLICARNGSPLLVGIGEGFYIISSDVAAFQRYTTNYFIIENQEILEIDLELKIVHTKIKKTELEKIYLQPTPPYQHFMLQEIFEQSDTVNRAMNYGSRMVNISNDIFGIKLGGLEKYSSYLKLGKNVMIVACGTSYFASMFVSNLMRKLNIFNSVQIVDGAEFSKEYIPKENPIMIFVSQSGETYDVLKPVNFIILFYYK
jgi:glucosamine--fructose-6-phosphate aminotransferase (isomerizing)